RVVEPVHLLRKTDGEGGQKGAADDHLGPTFEPRDPAAEAEARGEPERGCEQHEVVVEEGFLDEQEERRNDGPEPERPDTPPGERRRRRRGDQPRRRRPEVEEVRESVPVRLAGAVVARGTVERERLLPDRP